MKNNDEKLAEKDNLNAENNNLDKADIAEAEDVKAATDLGKFSSVEALLDAYKNLEAEFTRRSQRLKELEEGNKAVPVKGAPSQGVTVQDNGLLQAALADESVKNAVVGEYLKTVACGKGVPLIVGGVSSAAPVCAPKTVKEAGALAERFLKN